MMNCKKCIHEDVCKEWQYSISGSYEHPICRKPNHFKRKCEEHVRHGKWIENYGAPNVKRSLFAKQKDGQKILGGDTARAAEQKYKEGEQE